MITPQLVQYLGAIITSALLSCLLTWAVRPLLLRHALAKPNARSSHHIPTPQGAGIAVVAATVAVSATICIWSGIADARTLIVLLGATLFMAAVGLADDLRSVPVPLRLLLQALAVAAIVFTAPDSLRIAPGCPLWIERGLILLAGIWCVNLVNFMDGLDLMTVAETVPVMAAVVLLGEMEVVPSLAAVVAAALCGAMIGFAPFNRPTAKVFLGDVGSLPIGLLLGWSLLQLTYSQHLVAALLLPLYYLADATITLLRRMARREPFWAAHRSHFYQRATDNGFTVSEVVSQVFVLNVGLATLAIASTMFSALPAKLVLLAAGCAAVAGLIYRFSRPRSAKLFGT
jgi:UDP-N-acetylmuramyl pentapeptide phosphotransferase/UDP-N-acetylglucosamine-1-phosphate transferase